MPLLILSFLHPIDYSCIHTPHSTIARLILHTHLQIKVKHINLSFVIMVLTFLNKGRGCGGELYNYRGKFTSPMYPGNYRNESLCTWMVRVPSGMRTALKFSGIYNKQCYYNFSVSNGLWNHYFLFTFLLIKSGQQLFPSFTRTL